MDREWTEKTIAVKQFVCDVDCLAEYMISRTHNILQDSRAMAGLDQVPRVKTQKYLNRFKKSTLPILRASPDNCMVVM